jgi:hypothetical protein
MNAKLEKQAKKEEQVHNKIIKGIKKSTLQQQAIK